VPARSRAPAPRTVALFLLAAACADPPAPAARAFPDVDALPDQPELPDLFASSFDDRTATTAADWTGWRRGEIDAVLAHYAYGDAPTHAFASVAEVATAPDVDGAEYSELALTLDDDRVLHVAVFTPSGAVDVPAVLGPNRCGNHSLTTDERVRASDAFVRDVCPTERGGDAAAWPIAKIVAAGFALVTFHESELMPDDVALADGPALAAWARGSSLVLDALAEHGPVDASRVAVFGHSRRGKAALLASARDPRFAAVVAHQSGTLGSSILRNDLGESLLLITGVYPHWFVPELTTFVDAEDRLPFDQHWLLALSAPRPVLLVDGDADDWADPAGTRAAAEAASAAWALFGDGGFVADDDDATVVWRTRPGGHAVEATDWDLFLPFLAQRLR